MTPSRGDGGSLQAKTDIGWTNRLSVIAMPLFYWGLTMLQGVKRTLTGILSVIALARLWATVVSYPRLAAEAAGGCAA